MTHTIVLILLYSYYSTPTTLLLLLYSYSSTSTPLLLLLYSYSFSSTPLLLYSFSSTPSPLLLYSSTPSPLLLYSQVGHEGVVEAAQRDKFVAQVEVSLRAAIEFWSFYISETSALQALRSSWNT